MDSIAVEGLRRVERLSPQHMACILASCAALGYSNDRCGVGGGGLRRVSGAAEPPAHGLHPGLMCGTGVHERQVRGGGKEA